MVATFVSAMQEIMTPVLSLLRSTVHYINANRITNPQYQVALNDIAEKEAAKSEAEEKRRKEREAYEARRDAEIAKAAAEREARGDWVYDT